MEDKIKCPKCGHAFPLDEYMENNVRNKLKSEFDDREFELMQKADKLEKEAADKLLQAQKEFEDKEKNLRTEFNAKFQEVINDKVKELTEQSQKDAEKKAIILAAEMQDEAQKQINEAEAAKVELQRQVREAETAKLKAELNSEKLIDEKIKESQDLFEQRMLAKEQTYEKKLSDKEQQQDELMKKIESLTKLNDEMSKKILQGSMQTQGEVQELKLEKDLKVMFPDDVILEVPKGINGADVIQEVKTVDGKTAGKIVYESKKTQSWANDWIQKLQSDTIAMGGADVMILATTALPKGVDKFEIINGVCVIRVDLLMPFVKIIRNSVLRDFDTRNSQAGKDQKMSNLYNYLTSNEFKNLFTQILQTYTKLKDDLEQEKKQIQKHWKTREEAIMTVTVDTKRFYESITKIAGDSLAVEAAETNLLGN